MNWDSVKITLGSFLAYFVMSAVISPLGVVSTPIATFYDVSITTATAAFTYLTTGVLVGTAVAIFIFDYLRLQTVIVAGVAFIVGSIYAIYVLEYFFVFALGLAVIGICCGVELSAAAVVISKSYGEKLRASMLLLTDSFYSIAGVLSTGIAGYFVARNYHWSSAYSVAAIASIAIAGLAIFSKYPNTKVDRREDSQSQSEWSLNVHLVGVAMLVYLIGFVSIYSWVPNYAQEAFGASIEAGSLAVSRFFLGMIIGQLVMFFLVLKYPLRILIVIYAILATALTSALWLAGSIEQLQNAMLALGLATGGLFKTVLTFGTTLVKDPSPKMVSYLIFHSGFGTAIAPYVSSVIVENWDMKAALQLVSVCYVTMIILLAASFPPRLKTRIEV